MTDDKTLDVMRSAVSVNHEEPFILSSREKSPYFVDIQGVLQSPMKRKVVLRAVIENLVALDYARPKNAVFDDPGLVGVVTGGYGLATLMAHEMDKDLYAFVTGYTRFVTGYISTFPPERWPEPPEVVIVDDVLTTGNTLRGAIAACLESKLNPLMCYVVVDRTNGKMQEIEGTPIYRLTTLDELLNGDE